MVVADSLKRWVVSAAARQGEWTACGKPASDLVFAQIRRRTGNRHELIGRASEIGEGIGETHRIGVERSLEHRGDATRLDDLTGIHDHDAIADGRNHADVVRDQ